MAAWLGPGRERDAVGAVLAARSGARPLRGFVALGDAALGRGGELVRALAAATS